MSKLKVGDSVYVKATGEKGIIKSREVLQKEDKNVEIEYIVKLGEGFDKWRAFSKRDLEKVTYPSPQKEILFRNAKTDNGYTVTVIGLVKNEKMVNHEWNSDGEFMIYYRKARDLTVGYSICNPNDEFSLSRGINIARHRAETAPFCHIISDFGGEFNKETVDAILIAKLDYITKNINKFIKN